MPTYGWILESAVDRWSEFSTKERAPAGVASVEPQKHIWACHLPSCGKEFPSEAGLDGHLFQAHRHQDLVLRVGQRVYIDSPVVVDEPAPVLVVADGLDGIAISLAFPPNWAEVALDVTREGRRRSAEVPATLIAAFPSRMRLVARWGNTSRTFELYFKTSVDLDEAIALDIESKAAALQDAVLHGRPDWTRTQREFEQLPELERRYGLGLFAYLFAHAEVAADRPTKESYGHFERAFWLLSPFARPLGRMASDLIAFRLGWYDRFARTTVRRLEGASGFFRAVPVRPDGAPVQASASAKLILDDFHQAVIDVVDAYWANDHERAASQLRSLARSPHLSDRHLSEKFHLARARTARVLGDDATARSSYADLSESIWFKDEARAFV